MRSTQWMSISTVRKSTAPLHSKLLDRPEFRTVDMDIHWVERMLKED